jgi:hypothetical protein
VTTRSYSLYRFGTDRIEDKVSDGSSIVACVSVAVIFAYLPFPCNSQCNHVTIFLLIFDFTSFCCVGGSPTSN